MSGPIATAAGLVVGRGGAAAAGPLDFRIAAGEALVVTGANGAGKSTLLRTLAGLLPSVAGRIDVTGATAPDGEPARTLAEIAHYVGHRNAMKPTISVGENLAFWRRYLGGNRDGGRAVADCLDALGLPDLSHLPQGYLSAGQQRRASLARLLLVPRPVWILDEPTSALDAASQLKFAGIVEAHVAAGGLVIAATHQPLGLSRTLTLDLTPSAHATREADRAAPSIDAAELAAAEGWL
ncbi:putative heme export protein ccmA [Aurantimonas manganoxydans SI85-9A1]|uniref:Putative heme export protein ccmA n=1 Tax=Aurantimonas manganoxydans (strain ATCC BAA-1229 / DSM 21871 / SI85-9A1) TaxID=287752 RepID=Q1YDT0_AURMS|nr:heme ABC exporter ATP-binding protein CcmA [Aurantimonas manganoxydans]EAS48389.1 putative heme export protein ccmA [Aurantimonas manganoxydans SI85-9A1]